LIPPFEDPLTLKGVFPQFLDLVEQMPGLIREAHSRVDEVLYGEFPAYMVFELHFDSKDALRKAMASPIGQQAGALLQQMTRGRMSLALAEHLEDDLENIRRYKAKKEAPQPLDLEDV
jgi:uncharacterized protein (TIGR02118 family)